MRYLIKRNLLLYFRDREAVFYSVLSVTLAFAIYIFFLRDTMDTGFGTMENGKFLMDSWLMAGILTISPITTALSGLHTMVYDRHFRIYKDFAAAPLKRRAITLGYVISSLLVALIMTTIVFILAEVYIISGSGKLLSLPALLQVFGIIALNTWSTAFILVFAATYVKTTRAFGAISTLVGTFIGFLTGVYIPIGSLPSFARSFVMVFPPAHAALLLRRVMMAPAEQVVLAGIPAEYTAEIRRILGVAYTFGDRVLSPWASFLYLVIVGCLFFALSLWRIYQKEQ